MKTKKLPLILNVYRIWKDSLLSNVGYYVYHTAIEFEEIEYGYGKIVLETDNIDINISPEDDCGIYEIPPMSYEDGEYIESLVIGHFDKNNKHLFYETLNEIKKKYLSSKYNLILNNCNHFTEEFMVKTLNKKIPSKYYSVYVKILDYFKHFF